MRDHSTAGATAGTPANESFPTFMGYLDAVPGDDFCTVRQAAEVLGTSYSSLNTCRNTHHGLLGQIPFYKLRAFNGRVVYRVSDLEAHLSRFGRVDSRFGRIASYPSSSSEV